MDNCQIVCVDDSVKLFGEEDKKRKTNVIIELIITK